MSSEGESYGKEHQKIPTRGTVSVAQKEAAVPSAVPSRDPDLSDTLGVSCQKLDPTSKCQGKQGQKQRDLFALNKSFQRTVLLSPFYCTKNSKLQQWLLVSIVKDLVIMQLGQPQWMRPKGDTNGMTFFLVVFWFSVFIRK